jgi:hypothetical protein
MPDKDKDSHTRIRPNSSTCEAPLCRVSYELTCLLKLLTTVRTVAANGIPETPGPPASARGTPVQLNR